VHHNFGALSALKRVCADDLLCAAGGFNPGRVLPCVIDVGTNNELLRSEPWCAVLLR